MNNRSFILGIFLFVLACGPLAATPAARIPLIQGWQLQDASKVKESGEQLSQPGCMVADWLPANVPGTVLANLVKDGVYPEPLYGENNRADKIPDSLCRTDWWYRTAFVVPNSYTGNRVWLNFDGINFAAEVWVNGHQVGNIKGAFTRGAFDITPFVAPGKPSALAVRISPEPTPGIVHEKTILWGTGKNGGVSAQDGPTFLCTLGWDWLPGIHDRDTGIWQKVFLSATGSVRIENPYVTTDLPLPRTDSADIKIESTIENSSDQPVQGQLDGTFDNVVISQAVDLAAHATKIVKWSPDKFPQLHVLNPKLWWPNGLGQPDLHQLHLIFREHDSISDQHDVMFGIRKITYSLPGSDNLGISVNGVPVFAKGGDWGMDEALKRIPRERLEAQIKMHQLANYNMIRNWVGQSTSADFYDLCDKYGILIWDEFFQPNPGDGPNPVDLETYMANVRDKILRFRSHPSVALWCGRNEGAPPKEINDALAAIIMELDPDRLYQPSSTSGRGVHSAGPYFWRPPQQYYDYADTEAFKTEIGSVSIPTLESVQGMMPEKDWEVINDDWAEHDLTHGGQEDVPYLDVLQKRYGKPANLADFVRKGQLMNYEAFRAMYEGREAKMFHPETGVLTWLSSPAQPSFVWQIYHYDLEPNSALFAVRKACEPVHLQLNEKLGTLQVINNLPSALEGAKARIVLYNSDGSIVYQNEQPVNASPTAVTELGPVKWPAKLSPVYFVKLDLNDSAGRQISTNFYWRSNTGNPDDLTDLEQLPSLQLEAKASRHDDKGRTIIDVTLHNPGPSVALMVHLQLHRAESKNRVLPVYYEDNYVSLAPGEKKEITLAAAADSLQGEKPLVLIDGWNIAGIQNATGSDIDVALNQNAQVDHWPKNGIRVDYGPPKTEYHLACGGPDSGSFVSDAPFSQSTSEHVETPVDVSASGGAPMALYQSWRHGQNKYFLPVKPLPPGHTYTVRLHFADLVYTQPGDRKFDVLLNGQPVLEKFDIIQAAGGPRKAVVKEFTGILPDASGTININFLPLHIFGQREMPLINGIEILPN